MGSQDEEYQFSELEGADLYESEESAQKTSSKEPGGSDTIKQAISVVIALVIIIFVIYKIVGAYFYSDKPTAKAIPTVTKQVASVTPAAPSVPQIAEPAVIAAPNAINELETKIKNLFDQQATVTSNQVQQLQNNLSELKANQTEVLNKLTELNTKIQDLEANMAKQIPAPAVKLAPAPVTVVKPRPRVRRSSVSTVVSRDSFSLQAVIPGRAWLVSSSGATMTVSVGNAIPGYGQVRYIDAQKGRVVTSTGDVIKFDLNSQF